MRSIYTLLAIVLMQVLGTSVVEARGSALSWVSPCTLDVVLVTFQDATTSPDSTYDYHLHDRPYGKVGGRLTTASYRRHDFLRMLAGGYHEAGGHPTPFVGRNVTVANTHRLPEVFGSVRAYFDSVSNGAFQLHVRIVNPPLRAQTTFPAGLSCRTPRNTMLRAPRVMSFGTLRTKGRWTRCRRPTPLGTRVSACPTTMICRRRIVAVVSYHGQRGRR